MVVVWKVTLNSAKDVLDSKILFAGQSEKIANEIWDDAYNFLDETGWFLNEQIDLPQARAYAYEKFGKSLQLRMEITDKQFIL